MSTAEPILAFRDVRLAMQPPYECGLDGLSFTLRPGELALVRVPAEEAVTPLADLACGVLEPESGVVAFQGQDWRERSPDDAEIARATIGRVFERPGWISNLDLDENITLAGRYHGRKPDAELYAEAESLARALGQADLFRARPALIARNELRRSQWVRALLGEPALLLLERPARDVPSAWLRPLRQHVAHALARGAAVVWIAGDDEPDPAAGLTPSLHFHVRNEKLQPAS